MTTDRAQPAGPQADARAGIEDDLRDYLDETADRVARIRDGAEDEDDDDLRAILKGRPADKESKWL